MGRIQRKRLGRGVYHVLNRTLDGRWVFTDDEDRRTFMEYLTRFSADQTIQLYHWALMANHYHLAVETLDPATLSRWLGNVQGRYTRYYHKRHGGKGPLWQSRFKSVLVEKESYLGRLGRYIERNALRAQIAGIAYPWDYRWCSASTYVLGTVDKLVEPGRHPFWESMGSDDAERREVFARYLMTAEEAAEEEKLFRNSGMVIGGDTFGKQISQQSGRFTARARGRPRATSSRGLDVLSNRNP